MSDKRKPCPVCGGQPRFRSVLDGAVYCDHENMGVLYGPEQDHDYSKWDGMCRTIRARALAGLRAKVQGLKHCGLKCGVISRADVLALLDAEDTP